MPRKLTTVSQEVDNICLFQSVVDAFMNHRRLTGLSPKTLAYYAEAFHYVSNHGFPTDMKHITSENIEAFISRLLDNGMKPVTLNGRLRALKALFNFAHSRNLINHNPMTSIKFVKHEKHIIRTFDSNQIQAMIRVCADGTFVGLRDHAMMLLLLDSGARASEILGLTIHDVHLDHRYAIVMGKGRKARRIYFSQRTQSVIEQYLVERGELPHSLMFVTEDNHPFKLRSLQDRFREIGNRAQITGVRVSPHTFRHTFAKFYMKNGGDIFTLQK